MLRVASVLVALATLAAARRAGPGEEMRDALQPPGLATLMLNTGWSALVGDPSAKPLPESLDAAPFPCSPRSTSTGGGEAAGDEPPPPAGCAMCRKVWKLAPREANYMHVVRNASYAQTVCVECKEGRVLVEVPSFDSRGTLLGTRQRCARHLDERRVVAMRHAESEWNHVLHKYMQVPIVTGMFMDRWKDSPLSKIGLRQAQRLAMTLWMAAGGAKEQPAASPKVGAALGDLSQVPGGLDEAVPVLRLGQADSDAFSTSIGDDGVSFAAAANGITAESSPVLVASAVAEAQQRKDEALEVLLGHDCDNAEVVTSNLCRSMDTALIALLPLRAACPNMRWHVSSNLQETEVNIDCHPNLEPCHMEEGHNGAPNITKCPKPTTTGKQVEKYKRSMMSSTLEYVKDSYASMDTSRNLQSMQLLDRNRNNFEHYKMMLDELRWMFKREAIQNFVWSVHSIWVRRFVTYFADRSDESCQSIAEHKVENTAVIAFDVLKLSGKREDDDDIDARSVGSASTRASSGGENYHSIVDEEEDFKMQRPTTWEKSEWFVPTWEDFTTGIVDYATGKAKYKCCCSLPSENDFDSWSKADLKSHYQGMCKVAEVAKCGQLNAGFFYSTTRWHSYEKTFLGQCFRPSVCVPGFGCEEASSTTIASTSSSSPSEGLETH